MDKHTHRHSDINKKHSSLKYNVTILKYILILRIMKNHIKQNGRF